MHRIKNNLLKSLIAAFFVVGGVAGQARAVTVSLSTAPADVSPAYFMPGEEAAALRIAPYTDSGSTAFSSMTVRLNAGGNSCSLRAVSLYYDTDQNNAWGAGDMLVSSSTLNNCPSQFTFKFSGRAVDTQSVAYFIAVTPQGGDDISLEITSTASFKFGDAMAAQAIYPIVSAPKESREGSDDFKMIWVWLLFGDIKSVAFSTLIR